MSAASNPTVASNVPQLSAANEVASATAGAATLNAQVGTITSESITTAAGSDYTLTLTNSLIKADSVVLPSVKTGTNTKVGLAVHEVTPADGSVVIKVRNNNAAALDGTIKVSFAVI